MLDRAVLALMRYPRLNAVLWDVQYRLGVWRRLDGEQFASGEFTNLLAGYAPQGRILDLGCGTSANLRLDPEAYLAYHGVDISPAAIRRARKLRRPSASYEVADILTYVPRRAYDAILLREVVYYLTPQEIHGVLTRLAGYLAPGGVVLVQVWARERSPGLRAAVTSTLLDLRGEWLLGDAECWPTVYVLSLPGDPEVRMLPGGPSGKERKGA